MAILDGLTGALRASVPVPTDYIDDGPLASRLGAGFLDGETPHLVAYMKDRIGSGDFNLMYVTWIFDGTSLQQKWKWNRGDKNFPDGHNTRIVDLDGNGKDEVLEIGFALNGDSTERYTLGDQGIIHGDRFHLAKIDPDREGLQGYGVQQRNPNLTYEYYYDDSSGEIIWSMSATTLPRILRVSDFGGVTAGRYSNFIGDILGDWREEAIVTNETADELLIFTTDKPSDIRLYTLAHNPAYRNAMTLKEYMQSHHVDYFLGKDMKTPP
ncbi:hypothetical protein CSAL01_03250 [Colletotrichum salicis]|uniref:Rhamnogalacturonan lyase family 11 C-terminal domain-containing protein n=1 Tax=Colletotrichum salicis TaxID=1209931 RepID=A0A135TGP3_9PEZI|nr:hypothetical protein CSAL01_03250 [Colletotrichum salicis]